MDILRHVPEAGKVGPPTLITTVEQKLREALGKVPRPTPQTRATD